MAAGRRALWTWPVGAAAYLRTAAFGDATATDLGTFDSSDPLGPLAGGGGTLAYLHGDNLTTFEEGDCPASGSVLAAGRRWVAFATGADIEVLDPVTCHVEHSLTAAGTVRALALGGDILLSLARTPAGRLRIERFRLSTGAALGGIGAPRGTEPDLAVRGGWASYRTPHALRVLDLESGRAWTVWRPERAPIAAGLAGRRLVWIEDCRSRARLWSLRLPRDQAS